MPDQSFLRGGGELGGLIRAYDWQGCGLGPVSQWPQSLRVVIRLLLSAQVPMALWWGDDLVMFYNDAYRDTMAPGRHPNALGMQSNTRTDAMWQLVGPAIRSIMDGGGPRSGSNAAVVTGLPDSPPRYWDFDLCPVDFMGGVGGVLGIVKDVSADHDDDDQLSRTSARLLELFEQVPGFVCVFSGPNHVYEFVNLEYRALMGERDYIGRSVRDVVPEVDGQGFFELLDRVYQTGQTYVGKDLPMRYRASADADFLNVTVDLVYKALISSSGDIYGIFVEGTAKHNNAKAAGEPAGSILTDRERQVLGWIALGKTARETASILALSKRTCETYIYSAARKLDTANSIQTVVEAIRRGELKI